MQTRDMTPAELKQFILDTVIEAIGSDTEFMNAIDRALNARWQKQGEALKALPLEELRERFP